MSDPATDSTDWVLGQLETIARNGDPENLFYKRLLQSLIPILKCQGVLLAVEVDSQPLVVHQDGVALDPQAIEKGLSIAFSKTTRSSVGRDTAIGSDQWIATRFPRSNPGQPMAILARFENPLTPSHRLSVKNLLAAFVEICEVRELTVENARSVGLWKSCQARCQDLSNAQSPTQLHRGVVEGLRETLQADRVSLYVKTQQSSSMIACSGVASIDPDSTLVKELQGAVGGLLGEHQPKLWNSGKALPQAAAYRLFLPWPSVLPAEDYGVLFEWSDANELVERIQRASTFVPMLNHAWQHQNRWLHIPAKVQDRALRNAASKSRSRFFTKRILALACLGVLFCMAMIPYPFYIYSPAFLEPTQQRFIHATADSFIEELFVEEGQVVGVDQSLVQLRSPSLELLFEEALGQSRALEEKRNGLRVAVNQVSSNSTDLSNQTRLSADLRLTEIQEAQAREKVDFFKQQQRELLVKSPIQGVVVGGDLKRELKDRPLQRGDVLFRIADMDGPWRLRLLIADRDGAYVQKALEHGPLHFEWGMENSTRRGLRATLISISREVDQHPTLGPCRSAIADVSLSQLEQPVIGALAYGRIACGRQPLWFIWSRPMVEFLQKRFWLPSPFKPVHSTDS